MIHGLASESADVFDLEAFALLSSFAERSGGSPKPEVFHAPPLHAPRAVSAAPAEQGVPVVKLMAFTALFFLFGAIGPILGALR